MDSDVLLDRSSGMSRTSVQSRLESVIATNRFTIAVIFPLVGAVTLVGSAEGIIPEPLAYNPLLILFGTLVMRSPLLVGILPRVGWWALGFIGLLTIYTYAIELVGVRTGWPYGAFEYTVQLGPMLVDTVPLALPLFFVPLVLNAYLLTILAVRPWSSSRAVRIPCAILAVVAIDLVLDPAAVAIGFWAFDPAGGYYGVPASNYFGWVLSGSVAVVLVEIAFDHESLRERARTCPFILDDLVSFVLLWGTINALYGQWLPVGVAMVFGIGLLTTDRYDLATVRRRLRRRSW